MHIHNRIKHAGGSNMLKKQALGIRWHGRGGQGVVTAAKAVAETVIEEGRYALASPEFGPERSGAPIRAFTVVENTEIEIYIQPTNPDVVVVLDPTLLDTESILEGTLPDAIIIINSPSPPEEIAKKIRAGKKTVWTLDASGIAHAEFGKNFPNTPVLGAFVRATGVTALPRIIQHITKGLGKKCSPEIVEGNKKAITRGFAEARSCQGTENEHAPGEIEQKKNVKEITEGGIVAGANAREYHTGGWRTLRPILGEQCIHCLLCWLFCPDNAVIIQDGKVIGFNPDYCKGCGICANVCPEKITAITMQKEGGNE